MIVGPRGRELRNRWRARYRVERRLGFTLPPVSMIITLPEDSGDIAGRIIALCVEAGVPAAIRLDWK